MVTSAPTSSAATAMPIAPRRAVVFGGGAFGTSLAIHVARLGAKVRVWHPSKEDCDIANKTGRNDKFLEGSTFDPEQIQFTPDVGKCLDWGKQDSGLNCILLFAIPTQFFRKFLTDHHALVEAAVRSSTISVVACKGIERGTLALPYQIFLQSLGMAVCRDKLVVLAGPSFAGEVAQGLHTSVTVASENIAVARKAQRLLSSIDGTFRCYASTDVMTCEVASAVKNVVAIAAGMSHGMERGRNARAALITMGLVEIVQLSRALGGTGNVVCMAAVGDLLLTASSTLSRNFTVGVEIGQKVKAGQKNANDCHQSKGGGVQEGVPTAQAIVQLAKKHKLQLPLCETVERILEGSVTVTEGFDRLLMPTFAPLSDEPLCGEQKRSFGSTASSFLPACLFSKL